MYLSIIIVIISLPRFATIPMNMKSYSRYTLDALTLLGKQIRLARKQRRWPEHELAERAGLSRATLQKIEKGEPGCAIGLVFEVAVLVGLRLFDADGATLMALHERTDDKLALLPKATHAPRQVVNDDF